MKFFALLAIVLSVSSCGSKPEFEDVGAYLLREKGPSVFKLVIPSNPSSGGTGFSLRMISGRVLTVTNSHVCYLAENNRLLAQYHNGSMELLDILAISDETDLCIMTEAHGAPALQIAFGFDVFKRINIIGHPLLHPLTYQSGYLVSRQIVRIPMQHLAAEKCVGPKFSMQDVPTFFGAVRMCVMSVDAFDTSAVVYGGNSGSPVLNDQGDVVGVLFASSNETHWGLVVPLDSLMKLVGMF